MNVHHVYEILLNYLKPLTGFRLHATSMTSKHSTIPVTDSLELDFAFHFWQVFRPWWHETCSYSTTVLSEKMWHFRGVKTYSDSFCTISGVKTPTPRIYAPAWHNGATAKLGHGHRQVELYPDPTRSLSPGYGVRPLGGSKMCLTLLGMIIAFDL